MNSDGGIADTMPDCLDRKEIESGDAPGRPTPLRVQADMIPPSLQTSRRWVGWNYEFINRKWTKVPSVATDPKRKASSTNPATWRTCSDAIDAYHDGKCDGIGFVLGQYGDAADRVVGVDLDHCVDGSGQVVDWAQRIVDQLDSYTELSPSGMGVRIFLLADGLPGPRRRKGPIEMYDTGRYLTVTGHHI
jgi:primase-polymerase (primpol)-like protein